VVLSSRDYLRYFLLEIVMWFHVIAKFEADAGGAN